MEIAAPPGTALILEPGGLDALPLDRHQLADAQPAEIAEGAVDAGQSQETGRPSEPAADVDMDGDRNRVIVRRRGTKGGGFFARRKDAVAPVQPRAAPAAVGQDIAIGVQLPEDVPPEEAAITAVSGKERRRANNNKNNSSSSVVLVKPGYSSIRTGIIKLTPESMKCKLYCRGLKCVYCNPENWTEAQQAIRGLYSNWINEHILASARPTARNFDEFDLIRQFKRAKIKTVFNLQCVNEHDFCGPPLVAQTGFSYDPELLMRNKIFYYNFAIPDFGTLPSQSILNIVKVIWFSLRHGRVAIHCHAGLGRTGTLIACFLVWSQGLYTADAIDLVRAARPNSVQSVDQINVVEEFAYHVHKYGTALPSAFYQASNGISLRQLMCNQRQFLPNEEARQFTHIPKLLYMLGDRLLRFVFEQDGIHYAPPNGHHARSCTFGTICVNWRNAFTARGKLQVRQVVNLLARCSAFPYEKDQALINRFQQLSLVTIDQLIADMDVPQLVSLLNAFMESIKKPYCSRRALIEALGHFSPDNPTGPIPESDDEEEKSRTQQQQASTSAAAGANDELDKEDMELVSQLVNPHGKVDEEADGEEEKEGDKTEVEVEVINGSGEAASKSGADLLESQHGEFGTNLLELNSILKEHQEGGDREEAEASEKPHEESATSEGAGNAQEGVTNMGQKEECQRPAEERHPLASRPESAFQGTLKRHSVTLEKCAEKYGSAERLDADERLGDEAAAAAALSEKNVIGQGGIEEPIAVTMSRVPEPRASARDGAGERPTTVMTTTSSAFAASLNLDFGSFQFEHHDSHTNKEANLNADWQCIVFYVCNMLSYLTGENYDAVLDLLTFWFAGDGNRDVKQAIYCHMRDLFARNMRQQEQQAAEWRRRMGLPEKGNQQQQQPNKMN